jgi:ATP-dependent DNA helicase PIF1
VDSIAIAKGIKNNPEQLRAFYIVAQHIINGESQLLMHIGGMGGTGKSYVFGAIVELFDQLQRRHELVIGAPTGIAAALIGGSTLHSLVLSNPSQNTQRSDGLAEIWTSIRYMIVDEVSVIGARFLAEVSSRIQIGKANIPWASAQPFGGVSIIFTGDFCQLTPPRQKSLFSYELVHSPSFSESRGVEGINNLAGAYL